MAKILEYFSLPDRMVSLCVYSGMPTVVIQDGELGSKSFEDLEEAIELFDMIIEHWLEEEKSESALFLQHPEVSA